MCMLKVWALGYILLHSITVSVTFEHWTVFKISYINRFLERKYFLVFFVVNLNDLQLVEILQKLFLIN